MEKLQALFWKNSLDALLLRPCRPEGQPAPEQFCEKFYGLEMGGQAKALKNKTFS